MKNLNNKTVALWGTSPPPIGGMQVHIQRLSEKLEQEEIGFLQYNFTPYKKKGDTIVEVESGSSFYLRLLLMKSPKIHYVITTRAFVRCLAALLVIIRRKKVIIRVGGKSLRDGLEGDFINRIMTRFALKHCSAFIGVNKDICNLANKYLPKKNAYHIPGFIPPIDRGEQPPKRVKEFLNEGDLKLVVSGKIYPQEHFDIYGLWDIIKLGNELKSVVANFRIVIFSYDLGKDNTVSLKQYLREINQYNLQENILLYTEKSILWTTLKYCDIFLRPSYTDGDCNALREALYFNTYSIASDVVPRPEGSIIYEVGNIKKLKKLIMDFYRNPQKSNVDILDNSSKIIDLIRELSD